MSTLRVVPVADLVEHATKADRVCGPETALVECDGGWVDWLVRHHSLDGRELR